MAYKKPKDEFKWKPGQSGNPGGRPKKVPGLDKLLAECFGDNEMEEILKSLYKQAKKGNVRAAEVILERAYGKAKQEINVDIGERQVFKIGGSTITF